MQEAGKANKGAENPENEMHGKRKSSNTTTVTYINMLEQILLVVSSVTCHIQACLPMIEKHELGECGKILWINRTHGA